MIGLLLAAAVADPLAVASAARGDCASSDPREIVVCGPRDGDRQYRLPKLPEKYDRGSIRAETSLAPGVRARAHIDSVELPGGVKSDRFMITVGVGF